MSIDIPKSAPPSPERRANRLNTQLEYAWNSIQSLRQEEYSDSEAAEYGVTLQNNLASYLHSYKEKVAAANRPDAYYRLVHTALLLPALIDIPRNDKLNVHTRQAHAQTIKQGSAIVAQEILEAFQSGVTFRLGDTLVGALNEVTPVGIYTNTRQLVYPATIAQDRDHKTDIIACLYDEDGMNVREQPIQCKTNLEYNTPINGVSILHADDYGNRAYPERGIMRDHEASKLLIEEVSGVISPDEFSYLEEVRGELWNTLDYRLTKEFAKNHLPIVKKAKRDFRFQQRIPYSSLKKFID